jgi:hypothetical protein
MTSVMKLKIARVGGQNGSIFFREYEVDRDETPQRVIADLKVDMMLWEDEDIKAFVRRGAEEILLNSELSYRANDVQEGDKIVLRLVKTK